jgi:DnaJ-domain-containing protein 1
VVGSPMKFQIDEKQLEKQYLHLQKKLHPDKYTTAEQVLLFAWLLPCVLWCGNLIALLPPHDHDQEDKRASMLNSSVINMAYQLLSSPTQRAAYLVRVLRLPGCQNRSEC